MEQSDSDQRGRARGIMVERRGRDYLKNVCKCSIDMDNSAGTDCGSGQWTGWRKTKGDNWDNYSRTTIQCLKKSYMILFFPPPKF